jgi:cell wall-associated NlpC family hydrolase
VASHRFSRAIPTMLTVAALALTMSSPAPATAQPNPPTTEADARKQYEELGAQAAKLNEEVLRAEEDLAARRTEAADAKAAAAQARAAEQQLRAEVDLISSASFQGARLNRLSALLTADSAQHFLEQMSALDILSIQNKAAMDQLAATLAQATEAERTATDAEAAAASLTTELQQRKQALDGQIKLVQEALNRLSRSERAKLSEATDKGSYLGPPGAANDALQAALSRRGKPYLWGATGPDSFDCSGLTSWAYRQAGITIPRTSRSQFGAGRPVPLNALVPGDLLFYDDGTGNPSAIHHVGMYVGDGKMVDAPTAGQVVDVRPIKGDGHLMGARRIAG